MKHKWHKEIKAWADGEAIETLQEGVWKHVFSPAWTEFAEYRIKQQPKEPQYLYVSQGLDGSPTISFIDHQGCIGKIKLEIDNDQG